MLPLLIFTLSCVSGQTNSFSPSPTQYRVVSKVPTIAPYGSTYDSGNILACLFFDMSSVPGWSYAPLSTSIQNYLTSSVTSFLGMDPSSIASASSTSVTAKEVQAVSSVQYASANPTSLVGFRTCMFVDGSSLPKQGKFSSSFTSGNVPNTLYNLFAAQLKSGDLLATFASQPDLVLSVGFPTKEAFIASVFVDPVLGVAWSPRTKAPYSYEWVTVAWAFPLGLLGLALAIVLTKFLLRMFPPLNEEVNQPKPKPRQRQRPVGATRPARAEGRAGADSGATAPNASESPERSGWGFSCMDEPQCLSPDPEPLPRNMDDSPARAPTLILTSPLKENPSESVYKTP